MQDFGQVLSDWTLSKQNSLQPAREQGWSLRSRKYNADSSHTITQKVRCASFNGLIILDVQIYSMQIILHLSYKNKMAGNRLTSNQRK